MDPIDSKIKNYLESSRAWKRLSEKLVEAENENVPSELIAKVKGLFPGTGRLSCPHCGKSITPFKAPLAKQKMKNALWAFLALATFAGSFLAPKYFFQFLAAFLFFGFRWIMDRRSTKTQIFVYKILKDGEFAEAEGRSAVKAGQFRPRGGTGLS